jgi:CDP-paratose 2-epimerase
LTGRRIPRHYQPEARLGDHIVYITNLAKFRQHYPAWQVTYDLDAILADVLPTVERAPEVADRG